MNISSLLKEAGFRKEAGKKLIFRASITIAGKKYFARDYGHRAFILWVKP